MKLFENEVGRPTNEIKKKRSIFVVAVIVLILLTISISAACLSKYKNIKKVKGSTTNVSSTYMSKEGNGYVIRILADGKIKVGFFPMGDANLDGFINDVDASLALRIAAKLDKPSDIQKKLLDMNGDGKNNSVDARTIWNTKTFDHKKVCVSEKVDGSNCNWGSIRDNSYMVYTGTHSKTYYIYVKDVATSSTRLISNFIFSNDTTEKKESITNTNNAYIDMSKYQDNRWEIGTSGEVYVNSGDKITEFSSSNPSVMRVKLVSATSTKQRKYIITAISGGTATITAKNASGGKVSYGYIVKATYLSPTTIFGSNGYKTENINGIKVYIDKSAPTTCANNYRNAVKAMTSEVGKNGNKKFKYGDVVAKSVHQIMILSNTKWTTNKFSDNAAGLTWGGNIQIALRCYGAAAIDQKNVAYHELGHAVDFKYDLYTGQTISDTNTWKNVISAARSYNNSVTKNRLLTDRNYYAFESNAEFYAQSMTAYGFNKVNNYSLGFRRSIGYNTYVQNKFDLCSNISESLEAAKKVIK